MDGQDLDALIGETRREAARRRAEPDFPLDDEARLGVELDRLGPRGPGVDMGAVLAGLDGLSRPDGDPAATIAALTASGLRSVAMRLRALEDRQPAAWTASPNGGRPSTDPPAQHPAGPGPGQVAHLDDQLRQSLGRMGGAGRVLVAGPGAAPWVESLRQAGLEAYGIDPTEPAYSDHDCVRAGSPTEHLVGLAPRSLSFVLVVGGPTTAETLSIGRFGPAAATAGAAVGVMAYSPWWWRACATSSTAADLAAARPLEPGTWIELLAESHQPSTVHTLPDGRAYLVVSGAPAVGLAEP